MAQNTFGDEFLAKLDDVQVDKVSKRFVLTNSHLRCVVQSLHHQLQGGRRAYRDDV